MKINMMQLCMILLLFSTHNVSLALHPIEPDLDSINFHWSHIRSNDILRFIVDDVEDTLKTTARSVIPQKNVADSPLNKFVHALPLETSIKNILLDYWKFASNTTTNLTDDYPWNYVSDIILKCVDTLTPYLVDALQQRFLILDKLKKEREKLQLKLVKDDIRIIVNNLVLKNSYTEDIVHNIISQITNSEMSTEIKEILDYPVVKQEITRAVNSDFLDKPALVENIMDALLSFLSEGVIKADSFVVNKYTSEIANDELEKVLIPEYKHLIKNTLLKASSLNAVFKHSYEEDNKIFRDVVDEYVPYIRKAISIYLYKNEFRELCLKCIEESLIMVAMKINLRYPMQRRHVREKLEVHLNILMRRQKPYIKLHDHPSVAHMENFIFTHLVPHRINKEYSSYIDTHRAFTKQNETKLGAFVLRLLESRGKKIEQSQFGYLTTYIPTLNTELSQELKSFQNDIENEAIKSYGFQHGMFTYSKVYFNVLEAVFISSSYSSNQDESVSNDKDEL